MSKAKNVHTAQVRKALKETLLKEVENLPALLKEVEPVKRAELLIKLIPFVLPKVDSRAHSLLDEDENKTYEELIDKPWKPF